MADRHLVDPDLTLIKEVKQAGGDTLKKCYQCATCSVACKLSPEDRPFPRKEMLMAQWGQTDRLMQDPDVWLCHQCNDCSIQCPREARPGDVLAAVRSYAYRRFAFPQFMGRALAGPKALPLLLLTPIVILLACILLSAPRMEDGTFVFWTSSVIDFNLFLPHSTVDVLFVFGNIMIFLFAFIGFRRFWKALHQDTQGHKLSLARGVILTFKEILSHARFRDCDTNRPRATAHLLLFFGFIAAMFTTGAVLVFIFIPHYLHLLGMESMSSFFELPLELPHPIKILGALGGVGLVVGGGMLVYRRWTNKEEVGANGYTDYLFLYVLFLTGLTGMSSWLTRYTGVPMIAYANYFVHMVCVYFLLWYMPYSKFAHMIYRTIAIVHAKRIGREPRS
jgi:quinone-modifying oxidoreductase subunit QmoC